MRDYAQEYLDRIKEASANRTALGRLSYWLQKHTRLHGDPFSFEGHEYQVGIIDSTHPSGVVVKPSQVGMSECVARLVLAFLGVSQGYTAIYTLPTVVEAMRFSKSRIDPIIQGSKYLKGLLFPGSDSAGFKQFGQSQFFMAGTYGKAIISIPADLVINDELDFSDQEAVITSESRLSHSSIFDPGLEMRGVRRKFSTPTVPGVGVSKLYAQSDQRKRLVKCCHCGHWFWPQFLEHVAIPGVDKPVLELSLAEVERLESSGAVDRAKLLCEKCHNPLKPAHLGPDYREWVAEAPEATRLAGWHVSPFDLPDFHTPASLLRKRLDYGPEIGHFCNFALGVCYSDASSGVQEGAVERNATLVAIPPDGVPPAWTVAALDVGKTSWFMAGVPFLSPVDGDLRLDVVWAERIELTGVDGEERLYHRVVELLRGYRTARFVPDSLPYTDTILRVRSAFTEGVVMPSSYTLRDSRLPKFQVNPRDNIIEANRTKTLDAVVKLVNNDRIKFADFPELETVANHLQGMKRVDRQDQKGVWRSDWVKTGPDHFFHCLNNLVMAAELAGSGHYGYVAAPVGFKEAFVGKRYDRDAA